MAAALVKRAMSLELAVEELWSCIMNEDVGTVGFYCTPGPEKIRVLVEVYNNFSTTPHGFDVVIWTPGYEDFHRDIDESLSNKIQDEIGGKIGFADESWRSKTVDQKAADIHGVLSNSRFVVLLDYLWKRVNLKKVGIPEPSNQNGSKLVFASRSFEVRHQMEARGEIKVVRFEPENVWGLFHEKFGHTLNRHRDIPDTENETLESFVKAVVKRAMSLELAVEELWSCIMKADAEIFGFYCTPRAEKMRVLVEVYNNFCTLPHGFPVTIWTPVYEDFDVDIHGSLSNKIQDEIGGKFGLADESWNSKTVEQKAVDIHGVLSNNRCVVWLDNLWERVDLREVGIPEPNYRYGPTLVFVTQSMDACRQMEARREIKVVCFEPENVWGLLREEFGHTVLEEHRSFSPILF